MKRKGLIVLGLLASLSIHAQDVDHYTPGATEEGVVYYLPKTQIKIDVTVTKETYTPGELCQFANRYLRLQNISSQPSEHWTIKSIQVSTIGIPDADKAYAVKLKDKTVTSQVELTKDGIIKAINTTSPKEEESKPVAVSADTKRVDARKYMTEEMLMAGSSNKLAELIAREIYNIRESKNSLTRGQADYMPQDGAALKLMLTNLEEQEKAMTALFSGTTEQSDQTFTFYVNPEKEITKQVVCRFSNQLGIVKENDLAGEPIYLSLSNESTLPPADEEAKASKKLDGVIYNIPGKGRITVSDMNKTYVSREYPITQFGETEVLTNNLFNKKVNTRVIFNPVTGGIAKIDKD